MVTLGSPPSWEHETPQEAEQREKEGLRIPAWDAGFAIPRRDDLLQEVVAAIRFTENVVPKGAKWVVRQISTPDGLVVFRFRDSENHEIAVVRPKEVSDLFLTAAARFLQQGGIRVHVGQHVNAHETLMKIFEDRNLTLAEANLLIKDGVVVRLWWQGDNAHGALELDLNR